VLLEQAGSVDLIGRLTGMSGMDVVNSYVLRVADTGEWRLLKSTDKNQRKEDVKDEEAVLAQGKVSALGLKSWHNLALTFQGDSIVAEIDRVTVQIIKDPSFPKGMVGLGTAGYVDAEFDNFKVEAVTPPASGQSGGK